MMPATLSEVRAKREEVAKLKEIQELAYSKWHQIKESLEVARKEEAGARYTYEQALCLLIDLGKRFAMDEGENCTVEKLDFAKSDFAKPNLITDDDIPF
jgi:hypothetical protein